MGPTSRSTRKGLNHPVVEEGLFYLARSSVMTELLTHSVRNGWPWACREMAHRLGEEAVAVAQRCRRPGSAGRAVIAATLTG